MAYASYICIDRKLIITPKFDIKYLIQECNIMRQLPTDLVEKETDQSVAKQKRQT